MKKMNLVIVGCGMYVCGANTEGFGTIMPAVLERKRKNALGDIFIAGASAKGVRKARHKIGELMHNMNVRCEISYFPKSSKDDHRSYIEALRSIPKPAA